MSRQVWKFPLTYLDRLEMPKGATILSCQPQGEQVCLWALVDPAAEKEIRECATIGTGWTIDDVARVAYVGTVQVGEFVWHVFEKGK